MLTPFIVDRNWQFMAIYNLLNTQQSLVHPISLSRKERTSIIWSNFMRMHFEQKICHFLAPILRGSEAKINRIWRKNLFHIVPLCRDSNKTYSFFYRVSKKM